MGVVAAEQQWIDLCDPEESALRAILPAGIHDTALTHILAPAEEEPRPRLVAQGDYVFGVLAFPSVRAGGDVVFQEVDLIANLDVLITVRKTPPDHTACEFDDARNAALRDGSPRDCVSTWWSTRSRNGSSPWSTVSTTASTSSKTT